MAESNHIVKVPIPEGWIVWEFRGPPEWLFVGNEEFLRPTAAAYDLLMNAYDEALELLWPLEEPK